MSWHIKPTSKTKLQIIEMSSQNNSQSSEQKEEEEEEEEELDYSYIENEISEINEQLTQKFDFNPNECSYVPRYAQIQIKQELLLLEYSGYDFELDGNKKPFFQNRNNTHIYYITRMLRLKFKCKNNWCPYYREKYREKKWNSEWGLVIFSFYFQKLSEKQKQQNYVPLIRYNFKIYKQRCLSCQEWGSASIEARYMKLLCRLYYLIFEIVFFTKLKVEKQQNLTERVYLTKQEQMGKRSQNKGKGPKHRSELCQACDKGTCPKMKKEIKQMKIKEIEDLD